MTELQKMLKIINETKDREGQDKHIRSFLKAFMEKGNFYIAVAWKENKEELRPFVGHFKNVPCFYVFTDSAIAINFEKHYGLTNENGDYYVFNISNGLETLIQYQQLGVPLVMFDEGAYNLCHNITYIIEIMKELKNDSIKQFIGVDKENEKPIVISNEDRLRNTLIVGSTASGKVSLSILPMIYHDLKKLKSATTVVSSNLDVLDKVHIMGQFYGKSVTFLNFTKPELYERKVAKLTIQDFTDENRVILVYASKGDQSPSEMKLFSAFSNKLLKSLSSESKEKDGEVIQSLYLLDTRFVSDYFEDILLGDDLGVAVTQSVETLDELKTHSFMELSDAIQNYYNLIVYPGISRHDEKLVKTRGIQSEKLLTLPFKEIAYSIGKDSGFAKAEFIPSEIEKEFRELEKSLKKSK